MNKLVFVFGAGEHFFKPEIPENAFIAAADGGFDFLVKNGITPDFIIGDFDSTKLLPSGKEVITLPERKDETDIGAAIRILRERGFTEFHIFGGTGGRFDHTLGNIVLACSVSKNGGEAFLYGKDFTLTAVTNGEISFPETASGTISIFAFGGEAVGVTLKGLLYPLDEAVLKPEFPLGISNSFIGQKSTVRVERGTVVVVVNN
jgi:thiamine pyrophosphokinase